MTKCNTNYRHKPRAAIIYIPPGFNTVTPYFFVKNAETFVSFLIEGLDGKETCRTLRPDGRIANVQIQLGTSTVMVSEATENYPPMQAAYYLYVENADQSMQRALDHGAMLEMKVGDMPYGDRQGRPRSPRQYLVDLATYGAGTL